MKRLHARLAGIRHGLAATVLAHDAAMAALSAALAQALAGSAAASKLDSAHWLVGPLIFASVAVPVFHHFRVHKLIWRHVSLRDAPALAKASGVTVLAGTALNVVFAGGVASSPVTLLAQMVEQWITFGLFLLAGRTVWMLANTRPPQPAAELAVPKPVLLVGAGPQCATLLWNLEAIASPPLEIVGILDEAPELKGRTMRGVRVLGPAEDLPRIVDGLDREDKRPEQIIVTHEMPAPQLLDLMHAAERLDLSIGELPAPGETRAALRQGTLQAKPITLESLVGRAPLHFDRDAVARLIAGRRVLVTGAGGSIGRELVGLIAENAPMSVAMLDNCEFNLWQVAGDMDVRHPLLARTMWLADIRDPVRLAQVFAAVGPQIVFHAAALKHVPMVESNPAEGILTNVIGSRNVADACLQFGVRAMVQVSTDKAVSPTSVMGATKRLAEFYCQSLDLSRALAGQACDPRFITVRFGNVLGSSGSVVPVFQKQIEAGGPVTVTHPEMSRYFMTIREACELVLQAAAHGIGEESERGMIYVLDMGSPVPIVDIARQLIRLNGLRPDRDIRIDYVGVRPGEKLVEDLFDTGEVRTPASIEGVLVARSETAPLNDIGDTIDRLKWLVRSGEDAALLDALARAVPGYRHEEAASGKQDAA